MTTNIIYLTVTAYCATGHMCANTKPPKVGITVAAPRFIKIGSAIAIVLPSGVLHRTIEDHTAKKYDGRIDIFMQTKQECLDFGIHKNIKVIIITK